MDLLNHNKLMTPILIKKFGPIYIEKTCVNETNLFYSRTSIIRQKSSNKKILDAKIKVQKNSISRAIFDELKNTDIPFGQLLKNYNVNVAIENLQLFTSVDAEGKAPRKSRKVDIVNAFTHALICNVEEILAE